MEPFLASEPRVAIHCPGSSREARFLKLNASHATSAGTEARLRMHIHKHTTFTQSLKFVSRMTFFSVGDAVTRVDRTHPVVVRESAPITTPPSNSTAIMVVCSAAARDEVKAKEKEKDMSKEQVVNRAVKGGDFFCPRTPVRCSAVVQSGCRPPERRSAESMAPRGRHRVTDQDTDWTDKRKQKKRKKEEETRKVSGSLRSAFAFFEQINFSLFLSMVLSLLRFSQQNASDNHRRLLAACSSSLQAGRGRSCPFKGLGPSHVQPLEPLLLTVISQTRETRKP